MSTVLSLRSVVRGSFSYLLDDALASGSSLYFDNESTVGAGLLNRTLFGQLPFRVELGTSRLSQQQTDAWMSRIDISKIRAPHSRTTLEMACPVPGRNQVA